MHIYSRAGLNEFAIALGYRQEVVKEYFHSFYSVNNDLSVDLATGKTTIRQRTPARWVIHLVDTGLSTQTGGRTKRLRHYVGNETFMCTYGGGVASIDILDLLRFHKAEGREATLAAVRAPASFGALDIVDNRFSTFLEKPQAREGWINGGFSFSNLRCSTV